MDMEENGKDKLDIYVTNEVKINHCCQLSQFSC